MSEDQHSHGPAQFRLYMAIAVSLAIFTAASFVVNNQVHAGNLTPMAGFWIILGVAVAKAVLVALVFMHLLGDWGKVYFVIVPVLILAALTMCALWPDMVTGMKTDWPGM